MRPQQPGYFQTTGQNSNFFFEQGLQQNQGQNPGYSGVNTQNDNFFNIPQGQMNRMPQEFQMPPTDQSLYRQSDPVQPINKANYQTPNFVSDLSRVKPQNILQTHIGQKLPQDINDQRKVSFDARPEPLRDQIRYIRGEDSSGLLNLPGMNQGTDSFNRGDNVSTYTDKRSNSFSRLAVKSPLNTFVMDTQNKRPMSRNSSRHSISENEDTNTDSTPIDIESCKITILSKDAEINYLKEQIAAYEEKDKHTFSGNQLGNDARIISMEHELQDLTVKNRYLSDEMDKLRVQVDRQSQDYQSKLANMKFKFEENAKKNMDMYERELIFKHNNNPEENMKYLKERIMDLEKRLKIKNPTFV